MNSPMSLDEAIQHAQDVADNRTDLCENCRAEHQQLADWLRELKSLRGKKIYVVQKGIYSDRHICGVSTSLKRAEDIKRLFMPTEDEWDYEPEIEEFTDGVLDDVIYRGYSAYCVWMDDDGKITNCYERVKSDLEYFKPCFEHIENKWNPALKHRLDCIAKSKEEAHKQAHDAFAKYMAENLGL